MLRDKWKMLAALYWYFLKTGSYTFGGGWSIVLAMKREFVERRGWLTDEELVDLTSVGRSLPGTMIGNVTYLFGYRQAGVPGGVVSLLGISTAPLLVMIAVSFGYEAVKTNLYVARALVGVRACVIPIILSNAIALKDACLADRVSYFFCVAAALLFFFTEIGTLPLVLLCGVAGYVYCEVRSR